jgi:hypothetical protein
MNVVEEIHLTLEALEALYREKAPLGWDLRVYDYTSNSWSPAEEAFARTGTYEMAVLTPPGGRPVLVRVLPPGGSNLTIEVASAGEMGPWRSLGVQFSGRHLELITRLLKGRSGPVTIEELSSLVRNEGSELAMEVLDRLGPLLPGGLPNEGRGGGEAV